MNYVIEQKCTQPNTQKLWQRCFAMREKAFIDATNDSDAIAIFNKRICRARTPRRLVRIYKGIGYNCESVVICEI